MCSSFTCNGLHFECPGCRKDTSWKDCLGDPRVTNHAPRMLKLFTMMKAQFKKERDRYESLRVKYNDLVDVVSDV